VEVEPELAAPVVAALARDGIAATAPADCPVVRARLAARPEGVLLIVDDAHGRASERLVADAENAAALIASWTRGDLIEPLLAVRPTGPGGRPPAPDVAAAAPAAPDRPVFGIAAAFETSGGFDGSVWFGAHLAGCARLGPTCLGALARFAGDPGLDGDSGTHDTRRLGLEVLLAVDFPIDCGAVFVSPGAGFGAGWMNATRTVYDPEDGEEEAEEVDGGGLRADAHVTLTIPLGAGLALDVGIGLDVWILAHTSPYREEDVILAGEPQGRVRGGLGLRYGAP
jgi:hypothetical protein